MKRGTPSHGETDGGVAVRLGLHLAKIDTICLSTSIVLTPSVHCHFRNFWLHASCVLALLAFSLSASARGTSGYVATQFAPGDFKLVQGDSAADIYVAAEENVAVRRCANDLAADMQRVTGRLPAVKHDTNGLSAHAVIVGTVDSSPVIQALVAAGKIDVRPIQGKWESFIVQVVTDPLPGVATGLIIVGSDRRGAIYGIYDVSEKSGVSPWHWFADVPTQPQTSLFVKNGRYQEGPPSEKYRGIFINDEMWSLRPWAEKTFDPANPTGLGPKTYAKIFEMMARLRANFLWPAMKSDTKCFNCYEANKVVADEYAIVMGSAHDEPMLRGSISGEGAEWDVATMGPWDYATNQAAIYKYWEDRAKANGRYDSIYTLGKRGQDDQNMPEGKTLADKKTVLEQIFADQRTILRSWVNPDITRVPQVFIPYSEVLNIYNAGLKVPDDVTICWPDNSFGYIRRLSNSAERQRRGGSGVYYHYQWLDGASDAWPWLFSTPLGLVWEEMHKAYEYGATNLWIVNVGDIKPYEIGIEYFMKLGWNSSHWNNTNSRQFFLEWATRDFGAQFAAPLADIMEKHGELGFQRRPEHMVRDKKNVLQFDWFSTDNNNDEAQQRADAYAELAAQVDAVYEQLPTELKDAFFELVAYDVQCAAYHNQKVIYAQKSNAYGQQNRASANDYAVKAKGFLAKVNELNTHYNTGLIIAKSKWNHLASLPGPWGGQWNEFEMPPLSTYAGSGTATLHVACEGGDPTQLDDFSVFSKNKRFLDLYNCGTGAIDWTSSVSSPCIHLSESSGRITKEKRLWITIDWATAPVGESRTGTITITGAEKTITVGVSLFNPASPLPAEISGFAESHGCVSMAAAHYAKKTDQGGCGWAPITDLGHTGTPSMTPLPTMVASQTTPATILANSPSLEYNFHLFHPGTVSLTGYAAPTLPLNDEHGIRYAAAVDDAPPVIVSPTRPTDVFANLAKYTSQHLIATKGQHVLKIWMVDPGVVLEKFVLTTTGAKPSYLGPPESFWNRPGSSGKTGSR